MHIRSSMTVPGTVEQLFGWWSDYTDGVIDDRSFSKVTRRVVGKSEHRVVMEDTFTRPVRFVDRTVVTLKPPDTILFSSDSRVWKTEGRYGFRQTDEGVEASVEADIEPQRLWKIAFAMPFVRGRIVREFNEDLRSHLEEFERDMHSSPDGQR